MSTYNHDDNYTTDSNSSNSSSSNNGSPVVSASTFTPAMRNNKRNNDVSLDTIQKQLNAVMEDNKRIRQELREVKEAGNSRKKMKKTVRDPKQSLIIRNSYKEYFEKTQNGWSFDVAPLDKENAQIRSYIFEACRKYDAELNDICSEEGKANHTMTAEKIVDTNLRITNAFYAQKRQHIELLNLSSEEMEKKRKETNRDARLREKFSRRMAAFEQHKDKLVERFGPYCEDYMKKEYMSDEEVAEVNEKGQTLSFFRLVPKWRSETLEEFYKSTDDFHTVKSSGNAPLKRVPKYIESNVSYDVLDELPTWGIKDEYLNF